MTIQDKAMLTTLSTSAWCGRRYDKAVSQEVAQKHGTSVDVGRYNKMLLPKEALAPIAKVISSARLHHVANSLPWDNSGTRLLPTTNYFAYTTTQRTFREELEKAADQFALEYPGHIQAAHSRLNGLFNASDYPDPYDIRDRFSMSVVVTPVPDGKDFRVDLADSEIDQMRENITADVETRVKAANDDLWKRLHDGVLHIHDRLGAFKSGDTKRLHDTLVGNLVDLTGLLTRLNVTNDPDLENMRKDIEAKLCGVSVEAMRTSESEREQTQDTAAKILDAMAGYVN